MEIRELKDGRYELPRTPSGSAADSRMDLRPGGGDVRQYALKSFCFSILHELLLIRLVERTVSFTKNRMLEYSLLANR